MSVVNGDTEMTTVPSPEPEVPSKRKREASDGVNGDDVESNHHVIPSDADTIQDIWALLKA